jgi:hypothetical protein
VLWRGDVGKSGGTVTLTHENGGALEQRRWHATLDHDGDAVLGHGGCRAGVGGCHRADERAWCGKREADRWDPAADFILN